MYKRYISLVTMDEAAKLIRILKVDEQEMAGKQMQGRLGYPRHLSGHGPNPESGK